MVQFFRAILLLSSSILLASFAQAAPVLNFSDLTNGPSNGLNDGLGSGAIVTLWGQKLGSSKGDSRVHFIDANGVEREVAHYYYWRNADGRLPGGPANLFDSHQMQEVAVSIPDAASGLGQLRITVRGERSNTLPFTVRSGRILHVKNSGNNASPGSFSEPLKTVNQFSGGAFAQHRAGDLIYTHGVLDQETTRKTEFYAIGMFTNREPGTVNKQTAVVSYPGTHSRIESYHMGFEVASSRAYVISKYTVLTGNHDEPSESSNTPLPISSTISRGIKGTADGRVVANYIADLPGRCPSSQSAAIQAQVNSGYDYISNLKVFGNQIKEYGCKQTSRYHHTTYFTVRWASRVAPFEFGWNYLLDNQADGGIHAWDELGPGQSSCGDWTGPVRIHDNVISGQRGPGFMLGTAGGSACWSADFHLYNNVFKDNGLGPNMVESGQRTSPSSLWFWGGSYRGDVYVYNNLFDGFGDPSLNHGPQAVLGLSGWGDGMTIQFDNNVLIKRHANSEWVAATSSNYGPRLLDDIYGSHNVFFSPSGLPLEPIPSWSANSSARDPELRRSSDAGYEIQAGSVALTMGNEQYPAYDLYGTPRLGPAAGAIEQNVQPSRPRAVVLFVE